MVNIKISELPSATSVQDNDLLVISQNNGDGTYDSKSINASLLKSSSIVECPNTGTINTINTNLTTVKTATDKITELENKINQLTSKIETISITSGKLYDVTKWTKIRVYTTEGVSLDDVWVSLEHDCIVRTFDAFIKIKLENTIYTDNDLTVPPRFMCWYGWGNNAVIDYYCKKGTKLQYIYRSDWTYKIETSTRAYLDTMIYPLD